ncbi:hypothetical protein B0H14DRAFT_2516637 [Mycena olivaceomarginata]|nr:hypothetical protein B0H14DRAFT_2516637 [Mycena olivaceomarginata]
MFPSLLSRVLAVALLGSLLPSRVHGSVHYTPNDIHCPEDLHVSFVHNSYSYYVDLVQFTNITDSFFDQSWYAGTLTSNTTGTDNVPGATRSGPFGGATYNETLTMYSKHSDAFSLSYHGKAFTLTPSNGPALTFGPYTETIRFESICGGRATFIDVLTYTCSDNPIAIYDAWYTIHMSSFEGLAAKIGAPVLAGDCPRAFFPHGIQWEFRS